MLVVIGHNDDALVVGKIKKAVIHKNSAVYFITVVYQAVRQPQINAYPASLMQEAFYCVSQADLIDHYPLPEYSVCGMSLLTLQHFRFMSSISDDIKVIILKTLPSFSEETQKQIITALEISGVEPTEDLKYVQQDIIGYLLPVIQHSTWVNLTNYSFSLYS